MCWTRNFPQRLTSAKTLNALNCEVVGSVNLYFHNTFSTRFVIITVMKILYCIVILILLLHLVLFIILHSLHLLFISGRRYICQGICSGTPWCGAVTTLHRRKADEWNHQIAKDRRPQCTPACWIRREWVPKLPQILGRQARLSPPHHGRDPELDVLWE